MSSTELIMNEKIKHLEEILKEYKAETERLSKNNEIAKLNLESSKFEIEKLQKEVMTKIKSIGLVKAKQQNNQKMESNTNLIEYEDSIKKQLLKIQENYNLSINLRLKGNIEDLIDFQKTLKVNYLLIKKIDIREDFLKDNKVPISSELVFS